jgi:hypothetical protein
MKQQQPLKLNIDFSTIKNMKCYCGGEMFDKVFNLKYLSPLQVGDPKGGTANVFMYRCLKCGQLYPGAMTQDQIEKIGKSKAKTRLTTSGIKPPLNPKGGQDA